MKINKNEVLGVCFLVAAGLTLPTKLVHGYMPASSLTTRPATPDNTGAAVEAYFLKTSAQHSALSVKRTDGTGADLNAFVRKNLPAISP